MSENTAVHRLVREQGPLRLGDDVLPYGPRQKVIGRARDVHDLKVLWPKQTPNTKGGRFQVGLNHTPLVYHDSHDRRRVVKMYLDENPQILEQSSPHAVLQKFRSNFTTNALSGAMSDELRHRLDDPFKQND